MTPKRANHDPPPKLVDPPINGPDAAVLPTGAVELSEGVKRIIDRTPELKLADREAAMKYVRKGRPLPPGKTFWEVIEGT